MPNVNKTFAESMTFTRASSATRFNAAGVMETVAANVPRINYAPEDIPIYGPELVTNGNFSNGTTGLIDAGGIVTSVAGGILSANNTTGAFANIVWSTNATVSEVKLYAVEIKLSTIRNFPSTALRIYTASASFASLENTTVTQRLLIPLRSAGDIRLRLAALCDVDFDNISIKEITGYVARKGDCMGLLIEEQRVNLLPYSEQLDNALYLKSALTISPNATVAPDGTLTADKVVEDASTGVHTLSHNTAVTFTGGTYVGSVFVKPAEREWIGIFIRDSTDTFHGAVINANTGTFGVSVGTFVSASVDSLANGWKRISIVATPPAGLSAMPLKIRPSNAGTSTTYTGDGVSGLYIWGAQLEQGSFPTSYIPTTSAAATRAVDLCQVSTAGWFNQEQGTFAVEFMGGLNSDNGNYGRVLAYGTGHAFVALSQSNSVSAWNNVMSVGTGYLNDVTKNFTKVAIAYDHTGRKISANNTTVAWKNTKLMNNQLSSVPTVFIGANHTGGNNLNGHIKKITYSPIAVSDAQLQALTV